MKQKFSETDLLSDRSSKIYIKDHNDKIEHNGLQLDFDYVKFDVHNFDNK